ncbi:hypothetical protein QYE76_071286 [Lolium multiflorum]|uniref:Uncharacterized protein n=1 Tax=Lolium multiflorum TaxID=4521 RepID=A0AAD8SJU4_LOLMU|nr:hypothetical protein QYE76_071286 [Lolium multiflorum]
MVPKRRTIGYSKPYPNEYELIPLLPKYRLPDFSKFNGSEGSSSIEHVSQYLAQQGTISKIDELRVRFFALPHRIGFRWYTSLPPTQSDVEAVEEQFHMRITRGFRGWHCRFSTTYEQRHPDVYQDKLKHAVVLVEADEDEGSAGDQEIFDLLLKEKQLKVPEGHKIPTAQELNGKPYCKWHNTFTHATNDCRVWRQQVQMAIEQGRLIFSQYATKVDTHSFPAINMVECTYPGRCQDSRSTSTCSDLIKTNVTLSDFNGQASDAQGVLNVDPTVGRKTIPTTFFIVDSKSTYVVLLGRDWIHANCCIPSTMHQCVIQWDGDEVEVVHAYDSAEISTGWHERLGDNRPRATLGINLDDCERIDVTKDGVRLVLSTGLTV